MIIVMKTDAPITEIERISQELESWNVILEKTIGKHKTVIGVVGDTTDLNPQQIQQLSPLIEQVIRINKPFK